LLKAAANRTTIEATCNDSPGAPDSNTIRGYLNAQLSPHAIRHLEQECNRALYQKWPHWLWAQPLDIALDLHDECYYGNYTADDPTCWVHKAEKRNGTRHVYRCATVAIVHKQVRLTLAVVFVHPDAPLVEVVKTLINYVRKQGLRLGCLYADKGFCSIAVLHYLIQHTRLSAIIAVPRKGAKEGVLSLCRGRASYFTPYTFHSGKQACTVALAVVRTYKKHKDELRRATWLVYALIRVQDTLKHIRRRYRARFGIDTGYRLMERVRARTCSQNPALRFFLMGLALVLVNVWVCLRCACGWRPDHAASQGGLDRFTLEQMARFLIRAVESHYGVVKEVELSKL
jgi:putative transposase